MDSPAFSRVLGVQGPSAPVYSQAVFPLGLVAQTFGPPEREPGLFVWNFADGRGRSSYSIYCEDSMPGVATEFRFVAPIGDGSFFEWATERLNLTHNGEIPPAFVLTHRTALRVERL